MTRRPRLPGPANRGWATPREIGSGSPKWEARHVLAFVPGSAFVFVFLFRSVDWGAATPRFTLFDDAMISMTYGRTLAETGELVWFPGAERVQGYTNPLWTLYMAGLHWLGLAGSGASLAVSLTGLVVIAGCAALAARLVYIGLSDWDWGTWAAAIAGGTVPLLYPLVYWTLRGMEVGFLALLTLLMLGGLDAFLSSSSCSRMHVMGLATITTSGVLGIATRMDFAVVAGAVALLALWWAPTSRSKAVILAGVVLPLGVAILAILGCQYFYYGDWLPNTYRLKVDGAPPGDRLLRGVAAAAKSLPLLCLSIAGLAAIWRSTFDRRVKRLSVALVMTGTIPLVYSVWAGGDAWEVFLIINRYAAVGLTPLLIVSFIGAGQYLQHANAAGVKRLGGMLVLFVALSAGYGIATNPFGIHTKGLIVALVISALASGAAWMGVRASMLKPKSQARSVAALIGIAALVLAAVSGFGGASWLAQGGQLVLTDQRLAGVGLALQEVTDSDAVVADTYAGAPAYYSNRRMIDLLGKSDRNIAGGRLALDPATGRPVDFYPGHSKYDSLYSIVRLKPDLVVNLPPDATAEDMTLWGYEPRCLPDRFMPYVLTSSQHVNWGAFVECLP